MFIYIRYNYAPGASLFLVVPFIFTIMFLLAITILIWIREKNLNNVKKEWIAFGFFIIALAVLTQIF